MSILHINQIKNKITDLFKEKLSLTDINETEGIKVD